MDIIYMTTSTPPLPKECESLFDQFLNTFFPSFETNPNPDDNKRTYKTNEYFVLDFFNAPQFPDKDGKFPERKKDEGVYGDKVIRRVVDTDPYTKLLSDLYQVEDMMAFLAETGSNLKNEELHKPKYTAKLNIDEIVSKNSFVKPS